MSDIDILVELDHKDPIGMKFFSYKDELEELLKIKVDVLTTEGMSPHVKQYVDNLPAGRVLCLAGRAA